VITLVIDASTYVGTVAVIDARSVIASGEAAMRGRDAEALMPMVADTLSRGHVAARELSRVVCGSGPGSFTSLRIGASIAKGVAAGVACPLFALSSLALLVGAEGEPRPGRYLAVLDALRGESYVGGYSVGEDGTVSSICAERLVRGTEVGHLASLLNAVTVGPGQSIDHAPHARAAMALDSLIVECGPVDLASWEPRYGRKAEAQMRWEASHRRPLPFGGGAE
jgi:tRNA threonylcarbamoyladenosine biosynthesis protein TsaB